MIMNGKECGRSDEIHQKSRNPGQRIKAVASRITSATPMIYGCVEVTTGSITNAIITEIGAICQHGPCTVAADYLTPRQSPNNDLVLL
jgi:hypothetical protein